MAQIRNQFYYVDSGRPILKTEYDDGSEDFYDASGQFVGRTWNLPDGTVIDPYADPSGTEEMSMPTPWQQQKRPGALDPNPEAHTVAQQQAYAAASSPPNLNPPGTAYGATPNPTPTPPPGPGAVVGQTNQNTELDPRFDVERGRYPYTPDAAQGAMLNALRDLGYSTYNNPYVQRLLQAAPALALSFLGQRALSPASVNDVPTSFRDFGQFLRDAIAQGQVFRTTTAVGGLFPRLIEATRRHNAQMAANTGGTPMPNENPFLVQLAALMSGNEGLDSANLWGRVFSPLMTPRMQGPWSQFVSQSAFDGRRRFQDATLRGEADPRAPNQGGNDWWRYIFGY